MELIGQHLTVSNSLSFSNSHVYIISPHTTHYCMYSSLCIFFFTRDESWFENTCFPIILFVFII